jgi:hypothetical protein
MGYIKVVTLFDAPQHAEVVKRHLVGEGVAPGEISTISRTAVAHAGESLLDAGLWQQLFGRDVLPYEAAIYGQGVRAGGVILAVRVCETELEKVNTILNVHNAVDIRKRAISEGLIQKAGHEPAARIRTLAAEKPADASRTLHEEHLDVLRALIPDPGPMAAHQTADAAAAAGANTSTHEEAFQTAADNAEVIRSRLRRRLQTEQRYAGDMTQELR